jgi:DNA polymerase-3 subunit alpha
MDHLALTEHGNVSSHVRLEQAADAQGINALFGCELYCGEVGEGATRRKNHLTVLASNDEGYRNLLRLVSRGWAEGFYYEPTVSGHMLGEHKEGLVVLSGCSGSLLATSLIGGKNIDPADASYRRAKRTAERMKHNLGDAYYLEVQAFPELEKTRNINQAYEQLSNELGIPLVATLDAHYTRPEESEMQMLLHNTRPGKKQTMEQQAQSWGYDVKLTFLDDATIYRRLVATGMSKRAAEQAIRNSRVIAERCGGVRLPKVENLRYPLPPEFDTPPALFRRWVNDGWKYRGFNRLAGDDRARYMDRVKYEMELIETKGFVDYFLVVSDAVRWAKDHGIPVGPARGSAAASLVCYLLRITEIDPMLFPTLLFERFIDLNRHDLPDIDLDFDDERRIEVKEYLEDKYGNDRVGNIGNFVKYKGKNSLNDVATAYGLPKYEIDEVKDLLITRSSGDLRAGSTIEDSIEMFPRVKEVFEKYPVLYKAMELEGNYKLMSIHAAGLVVANGPLSDFCAVYTKTNTKGETVQVVSLDKYDAEYLNVLKLDALGLNTMAMIRYALEAIGMTLTELYSIPLDDERVIRGFQENDLVGIFQFDGRAMRSVNQGVRPDNFMEIADVNALARPGPLHSGATAEYIDVKHGRKEATHFHPIIDEITHYTHGQIVYQEQILQVVRLLGNFSWEEAARIRKIISKKRGEQEFNTQRDKFVAGAATHGMTADDAHKVFSMLATAGAYAFNAAHCVSYGMLAYWTMYLKRLHPEAFFMGALRKYDPKEKGPQLLADMLKQGRQINVAPLDINHSESSWAIYDGALLPGWSQVPGIGPKTTQAILDHRTDQGEFESVEDLLAIKGIGPKTLELLDGFANDPDPFKLRFLTEKLDEMRQALLAGVPMDARGIFMLPSPTHRAAEVPYERSEGSNIPVTFLGVVRNRNLKDLFEAHHSRTGEHLDPRSVKDPHLNEWVVMLCEDETDVITVTCTRWKYSKFKDLIWSIREGQDLVLFRGHKMAGQSRRAIYISDMWVLDPDEGEET